MQTTCLGCRESFLGSSVGHRSNLSDDYTPSSVKQQKQDVHSLAIRCSATTEGIEVAGKMRPRHKAEQSGVFEKARLAFHRPFFRFNRSCDHSPETQPVLEWHHRATCTSSLVDFVTHISGRGA